MPLNLKIKCSGETHVIAVSMVDEGQDCIAIVADITHDGHDRECDEAAQEFGYVLPRCYEAQKTILDGRLFEDEDIHLAFFDAMAVQGIEALGMDRESFAHLIMVNAENNRAVGSNCLSNILALGMKWFGKTRTFKRWAPALAKLAYDEDDTGLFYVVNKIFRGDLIKVVKEEDEDSREAGMGHEIRKASIKIFIDDKIVDKWSFGFIGYFDDLEEMSWNVDRLLGSGFPSFTTEDFFRAACFENSIEGASDIRGRSRLLEAEYKPEKPVLPQPSLSGKGKWVIFLDNHEWGRFENEDDAHDVYDAMYDASQAWGVSIGITLRLMHIQEGANLRRVSTWDEIEIHRI